MEQRSSVAPSSSTHADHTTAPTDRRMHWAAAVCLCAALASQYDEAPGFARWSEFSPTSESLPGFLLRILPVWISASCTLVLVSVVVVWAIWESTRFPRHLSMTTTFDKLRIFVQLFGDILLTPVFAIMPGEVPVLGFKPTDHNEAILKMCPSLRGFKHTPWLRNPYLSFTALMCFDMTGANADLVERELLQAPDGGTVALDWWKVRPEGSVEKLLFIGSTFTGDALPSSVRDICLHFSSRGWYCVVMVKRGCGLSMPNVQNGSVSPWDLSGFDDMNLAVDHVASLFPKAFICGLGLSCGAAQLRNYVNMTGVQCKIGACVNVDAAEEWETTLVNIDKKQPLLGLILAGAAARAVDNCRPASAKAKDTSQTASEVSDDLPELAGVIKRETPKWMGLMDFIRVTMAPAHGFSSSAEGASNYLRGCQPADPVGCRVPVLELMTYNDTLIDPPGVDNLMRLPMASPHIVTCSTRWGTHIIRWQGIRPKCWTCDVACEFLEASLSVLGNGAVQNE